MESRKESELAFPEVKEVFETRTPKKGRKNWMRNLPCTCGSGKKLKKCCWGKMAKVKVVV